MQQDNHTLITEAHACAQGLSNLFVNMGDIQSMDFITPYEITLLLQPVIDRLGHVLRSPDDELVEV